MTNKPTRRRFYTVRMTDGSIRVLSLLYRPSPSIVAFNTIEIAGPFRTLVDASIQLEWFAKRG
jgi:hypothetical protein